MRSTVNWSVSMWGKKGRPSQGRGSIRPDGLSNSLHRDRPEKISHFIPTRPSSEDSEHAPVDRVTDNLRRQISECNKFGYFIASEEGIEIHISFSYLDPQSSEASAKVPLMQVIVSMTREQPVRFKNSLAQSALFSLALRFLGATAYFPRVIGSAQALRLGSWQSLARR